MATKVYAYGCGKIPRETREAIDQQLWLAHGYRVMLWHLAMAGRANYRSQRLRFVPELAGAERKLARAEELYTLIDRKENREEHQRAKVALQQLRAKCRELRELAKTHPGLMAAAAESSERMGVLQRALRSVFSRTLGLYSGTYLHVEAAARSANAGKEDPQRPRWNGSGVLAVQLQGAVNDAVVHGGKHASICVEPCVRDGSSRRAGSRTVTHYRLRSDPSGKAVMISLPTMFHRDLPRDCRLSWVKLIVTRVHEHRTTYSVQFTVDVPDATDSGEHGAGVVAISLRGDRVHYACEYGEEREFVVDDRSSQKIRDLQGIRDKHCNDALGLLVGWCDRQDETPDWVRAEIDAIATRRSCRRLYHLRKRLRGVVDGRVSEYLDRWAYREDHLYVWQSDCRRTALLRRRDAFRCFARRLRREFRTVVIDGRKLDDPTRLSHEARDRGLSELRAIIGQVFGSDAHRALGGSCAELCAGFRGTTSGRHDDAKATTKRAKRTGFARKHVERREKELAASNITAE